MAAYSNNLASRVGAAWRALKGSGLPPTDPAPLAIGVPPIVPAAAADIRNRVAALELDLRERDVELARVREEYDRLRQQAERERAGAASAGLDALARRLAPLLSQLATMQALTGSGRPVRTDDVLKLFSKLEAVLAEAGLVRIGTVGEAVPFDTRLHQRMSGADVRDGDPVAVRFIGYRLGESILCKAMVSRVGAGAGDVE